MGVFHGGDGRRILWIGLGLVVAVAIGLALFRYIGSLLFAIFLYYAIRPVYRWLDRHLDHPDVTASITILLVVVPMMIVVSYAVFIALQELDQLLAASEFDTVRSSLDSYLSLAREGEIAQLREVFRSETGASAIRERLPGALDQLLSTVESILGILAQTFLMIIFLFYLLRDDDKLREWFSSSIDHDEEILSFLRTVDDDLETIFLSNLAIVGVATLIAAITYVGLNLITPGQVVETPVLLALLIGIGTLIPVVGMKIVYVPYGLYLLIAAVATSEPIWEPIAFLVLTLVIVDTIPDFFARALLSSRSGVHTGLILLGYVLGTLAFGWYGLFLGPIVVVLAVHFAHEIFPELASLLLSKNQRT